MTRFTLGLAAALVLAVGALAQETQPTTAPAEWPAIGSPAPDFSLPNLLDPEHAQVSLSETVAAHPVTVVMWHSVTCPYVVGRDEIIVALANEYTERGVAFLGVNSNNTETPEEITGHIQGLGYAFPMLRDEGNVVADQYGATRTPEVYVVDPDGTLRYHGRINDSVEADRITSHDLRNALDALLAGEEPPVTTTVAVGCTIKRD